MDLVDINIQMVVIMKDNGNKIKCMVMVHYFMVLVIKHMKDNLKMINFQDLEHCIIKNHQN